MHFRGTNAINSKITGSGIGLMLVRKLVSLHNGKIYIESTECQGSTVRIILPKEKEQFKNFTLSVKDKKTFYEPDVPTVPLKLAGELRTEDNYKMRELVSKGEIMKKRRSVLALLYEVYPSKCLLPLLQAKLPNRSYGVR